ncbi:hypothetical protein RHMOL_Rhmol01G0377800 [Rhododendron molle]|uniref:Uncharacterized protein n=1 Tax=Rhododendron molle TaxID=49168 RepID=A0ACC0Q9N4_RHOML|nr:hypothetical protein RHMOL_Rhmol01G0377800 [Rhododendron molle]
MNSALTIPTENPNHSKVTKVSRWCLMVSYNYYTLCNFCVIAALKLIVSKSVCFGTMSRSSRTLYVGNLPGDTREREVEDLFYKYGPIAHIDLKIPPRPPGYAFVEFEESRDAEDAIRGRDGYDFDGNRLRVELAHGGRGHSSSIDRYSSHSSGRGSRGGGVSRRSEYRVLVTGLPSSASWQDLKDHMRRAGDVCFSQVFRDGRGTTGIVDYTNYDDMKYAIRKLDDSEFRNAFSKGFVRVREYKSSRSRSLSNSRSPSRSGSYSRGRSYSRSRSRSRSKSPKAKSSRRSPVRSPSRSASPRSGSKPRSLSSPSCLLKIKIYFVTFHLFPKIWIMRRSGDCILGSLWDMVQIQMQLFWLLRSPSRSRSPVPSRKKPTSKSPKKHSSSRSRSRSRSKSVSRTPYLPNLPLVLLVSFELCHILQKPLGLWLNGAAFPKTSEFWVISMADSHWREEVEVCATGIVRIVLNVVTCFPVLIGKHSLCLVTLFETQPNYVWAQPHEVGFEA